MTIPPDLLADIRLPYGWEKWDTYGDNPSQPESRTCIVCGVSTNRPAEMTRHWGWHRREDVIGMADAHADKTPKVVKRTLHIAELPYIGQEGKKLADTFWHGILRADGEFVADFVGATRRKVANDVKAYVQAADAEGGPETIEL